MSDGGVPQASGKSVQGPQGEAKQSEKQPKDLISLLLKQKCQSCEKYTCEKCLDQCDGCSRATCRMCLLYVCGEKVDGNFCQSCLQQM